MGRGILMRGEHAGYKDLETEAQRQHPLAIKSKLKLNVPFNFPNLALNRLTMTMFNLVYYHHHPAKPVKHLIDYDTFFYPLDTIANWNRIYGKRGFTQYQFIRAYRRNQDHVYVLPVWRYIMLIIRHLPEFIFKRLNL